MSITATHPHPARSLSHVRAAIYGEPWLIAENGMEQIVAIAESHAAGTITADEIEAAMKKQRDTMGSNILQWVEESSTAIVSVHGPIFAKSGLMTQLSGATSSAAIGAAMDTAVAEGAENIVLHIDSPGGQVTGGFELADKINEISEQVPVFAYVEGMGASLAYLLASQAVGIFLTRTTVVGSISVVFRAENNDRAMRNAGVDSITLRSGDRKQVESVIAAGNSTTAQMASVVRRIDKLHGMFVEAVARGRANLDAAAVATGAMWTGSDAVEAGLADEVMTFEQFLSQLA